MLAYLSKLEIRITLNDTSLLPLECPIKHTFIHTHQPYPGPQLHWLTLQGSAKWQILIGSVHNYRKEQNSLPLEDGKKQRETGPPSVFMPLLLLLFSHFATSWNVACQAPPSMGFPRQEYGSGLPLCVSKKQTNKKELSL